MLLQWCYFGAGIVALIALREKSDHDAGHEAVIFDNTSFAQLRRISTYRGQGTVKTDIDKGRQVQTMFETEAGEESNKLILRRDSFVI